MPILTQEAVLKALSTVQEPELGGDLVSRNMIKDVVIEGTKVSFTIDAPADDSSGRKFRPSISWIFIVSSQPGETFRK